MRKHIGQQSRILENLDTAVMLFDEHLVLRYVNTAVERLWAAGARQLLGSPADKLFTEGELFLTTLREAQESGDPVTRREITLDLAHGQRVTVDMTVTPMLEGNAGAELLVEVSQVDRMMRISRDDHILQQHQATRDLIRGLAHEVKNPLGGLRGAAQLLERELDDEDLKEYTQVIISEADRLQKLVNRMLGPNTRPHQQLTNVHEVLERVRSVVLAEVQPDLHILRDYDPSIPDLQADREQLIQVFLNIVRNAVEVMHGAGNVTLRTRILRQFTIGHARHRLVARVDVIDNGPGIPEDLKDKIFFPMVTGRAEGTGLGLSIAQSLTQQHGGIIECESAPGQTVFTTLLPISGGEPAK
ncbi:MAG: nitrogen regulation protein NR(II) [Pseudomonadota bacterium]|nr:MAG: nitrogen regulation protein NR(II) [Pseudomonadota bacterium]